MGSTDGDCSPGGTPIGGPDNNPPSEIPNIPTIDPCPLVPKMETDLFKVNISNQVGWSYQTLVNWNDGKAGNGEMDVEYGTEIYANFKNSADWYDFKNYDVRTFHLRRGEDHSYIPRTGVESHDNKRRLLGYMHSHPTPNTSFSPADIRAFFSLRSGSSTIVSRRAKDAISVVVTPTDAYALKIVDPAAFRNITTDKLYKMDRIWQETFEDTRSQEMAVIKALEFLGGSVQAYKVDGSSYSTNPKIYPMTSTNKNNVHLMDCK